MDELRQPKKTFSRLGWCYIAGTVAVYGLQFILGYLITAYRPEWFQNMSISLIISAVTVYMCGMPLIALLTKGMEKDRIERHKMKWWEFLVAMIICYSLVYISNLCGVMFTTVIGALKGGQVQNNLITYVTGGNMLLNFVLMVIVAPIVEEYVFRKIIVDRTVRYGQGIAIAASGLMFGLFHGNLNQFVYAVGLGAFFAFIYIKTGNLKITIAMHAIINFMGSMVAGGIFKLLKYEELLELDLNNTELVEQFMIDNLAGWMVLALYAVLLFSVVIAGIVLFIVNFKKFRLEPGREQIPGGKLFSVLLLNPGMAVFSLLWVVLIVIQLLV